MYIPAADGRPRESSVECVIILVDYAVFLSDPSFQMPGDRDKLIKVIFLEKLIRGITGSESNVGWLLLNYREVRMLHQI